MSNISALPIWKKGSTPAEWLQEMAAMALQHPDRFGRIVVIYEKVSDKGISTETRHQTYGIDSNTAVMASLEFCKLDLWEYMKGRR